jgi:hypothetical protein
LPVSPDERRYFVLVVSDHRKGNHTYFEKFFQALDSEEVSGFLHDLLRMDLTGFRVRNVPHTKGLAGQKLLGGDSVTRFWFDCLHSGSIPGAGIYDWSELENPGVVTQVLHACYVSRAREYGERYPTPDSQLTKRLKELWTGCATQQCRSRTEWTPPNGDTVERPQRYRLDTLENHRSAFLQAMKIDAADHAWPAVKEEEP